MVPMGIFMDFALTPLTQFLKPLGLKGLLDLMP